MTILAEQGLTCHLAGWPNGADGRSEAGPRSFYASTPATARPSRSGSFGMPNSSGALDWAEQERLIAIGEIGDITYIWLTRPDPRMPRRNRARGVDTWRRHLDSPRD